MSMFVQLKWKEYNDTIIREIQQLKRIRDTENVVSLNEWGQEESSFTVKDQPEDDGGLILTLKLPITQEIQFDGRSNFVAVSDFFGGQVVSTIQRFANIFSALGGTATSLSSIFDYQLWDKTEPLKINLEITLSTQTNVLYDVIYPAKSLMALTGMTRKTGGGFLVPGVNLANSSIIQKEYSKKKEKEEPTGIANVTTERESLYNTKNSKFIEVSMPFFYSQGMLITEARPQYNSTSALTSNAFSSGEEQPASIKVSLQLQSLYPMHDTLIFSSGYDQFSQ